MSPKGSKPPAGWLGADATSRFRMLPKKHADKINDMHKWKHVLSGSDRWRALGGMVAWEAKNPTYRADFKIIRNNHPPRITIRP